MERKKQKAGIGVSCVADLIMPDVMNSQGCVHGGELVKYMDNAAGIAAIRFCQKRVTTACMDGVELLAPVGLGSLLTCKGKVTFAGNTSVEVLVEAWEERIREQQPPRLAVRGYFTMVALEKGRPSTVPELLWETKEEEEAYLAGKVRYEERKRNRK